MWTYARFALKAMGDITGTILAPAVLAVFLGKILREHYHTGKTSFALLLGGTFAATSLVLVKKVRLYAKEYQNIINAPVLHDSAGR